MRILGVDPGTLVVGYGCLELHGLESNRTAAQAAAVADAASRAPVSDNRPMAHRVQNLAQVKRGRLAVVAAGALHLGRRGDAIASRLGRLAAEIRRLIAELDPDELALEDAYFGKSVQSALRIGESRGVVLAEASRAGLVISQFSPARIKRSVTGAGAANKDEVARMVCQTLQLSPVPSPRDVTDALAVGLCCIEAKRSFRPASG